MSILKETLKEIKNLKEDDQEKDSNNKETTSNDEQKSSISDIATLWKSVEDDFNTVANQKGLLVFFANATSEKDVENTLDILIKELPTDDRFNSLSDSDFKTLIDNLQKLKDNSNIVWEYIVEPGLAKDKSTKTQGE